MNPETKVTVEWEMERYRLRGYNRGGDKEAVTGRRKTRHIDSPVGAGCNNSSMEMLGWERAGEGSPMVL